jgi:hypothetical protein
VFPIYVKDEDFRPPEDPIYYLVTGDGIFLVKNHPLFQSRTKVSAVAGLEPEAEGFLFRGPKLKSTILAQCLAFFKSVWERYRSEGVVIFFFKPSSNEYLITVPRQVVGAVHCVYEEPPRVDHEDIRVGTIHSHGGEDPFHSDRDDTDESFQDGLHLIFGNLDSDPALLCSAVADGRRFGLDPEGLIQGMPSHEETHRWKDWAVEQMEQKVTPLEKPIHFGT